MKKQLSFIPPPSVAAGIEGYSDKIKPPVYHPSGHKPSVYELVDRRKALELIAEAQAADLPAEVKDFLCAAATRHYRFDYQRIADYYAHSPAYIQRLIERSALVIIDFDQAIELGYVKLAKRIVKQYRDEYSEEYSND